jgi:hypothetical protein
MLRQLTCSSATKDLPSLLPDLPSLFPSLQELMVGHLPWDEDWLSRLKDLSQLQHLVLGIAPARQAHSGFVSLPAIPGITSLELRLEHGVDLRISATRLRALQSLSISGSQWPEARSSVEVVGPAADSSCLQWAAIDIGNAGIDFAALPALRVLELVVSYLEGGSSIAAATSLTSLRFRHGSAHAWLPELQSWARALLSNLPPTLCSLLVDGFHLPASAHLPYLQVQPTTGVASGGQKHMAAHGVPLGRLSTLTEE